MSPEVFPKTVFPLLDQGEKIFFILIDNFRLDLWLSIKPLLADYFTFEEQLYTSILPTATQYARNSIFSGLMPIDIANLFPHLWVDEDEDEGKNLNESELVQTLFERFRRRCRFSYNKINDSNGGERLLREFANLAQNDLNIVVLNFIDMLSHARTESRMIRELARTDAAYRSLAESWFRHSSALELFRRIAETGAKVIVTTDHGTIRVDSPVKLWATKTPTQTCAIKWARTSDITLVRSTKSNAPSNSGYLHQTYLLPTYLQETTISLHTPTTTTTTFSTIPTPSSTAASPSKRC
jgi:hypothetical protein